MKNVRVLIVDDSSLARGLIEEILSADKDIEVVGEAKNGREAVEKVKQLKPNIVTMDIEMPVMDGLQAIEEIMAYNAVPILVVTTRGDAKTAYAAISKGALDLIVKPDISVEEAHEFAEKVKLLSKIRVVTHITGKRIARFDETPPPAAVPTQAVPAPAQMEKPLKALPAYHLKPSDKVIAIASSTGGPDALSTLLSGLPENFPCPIIVAQHMSDGFVSGMVEWLDTLTPITVKVASEGEELRPATAYISPSEKHTLVSRSGRISFAARQTGDIYRPSCDKLLGSVAQTFGAKTVGVILTGMGSDGAAGMKRIKEAGGYTIAQDEKTCIVFGMPKVAIESGCIDTVLPIDKIVEEIVKHI